MQLKAAKPTPETPITRGSVVAVGGATGWFVIGGCVLSCCYLSASRHILRDETAGARGVPVKVCPIRQAEALLSRDGGYYLDLP